MTAPPQDAQKGAVAPPSDELLEMKAEFMGIQHTGYPGAFPPKVEDRIRRLIGSPSLHLFSGRSKLGDVRIDMERPEATLNQNVFDFIKGDERMWPWVIADPPYQLMRPDDKLRGYALITSVASDIPARAMLTKYLQDHAENILWFDTCIPPIHGFEWRKFWLYHLWSWGNVRVLTHLQRKGERLA